jgi:PhzF family phenazine biosynthesis protein
MLPTKRSYNVNHRSNSGARLSARLQAHPWMRCLVLEPHAPCLQVDAFTNRPFGGNAAAVCLLHPSCLPLADKDRQLIAAEMNQSETAFVELAQPVTSFEASQNFRLRWCTPTTEVPLCGHATLAAAACILNGVRFLGSRSACTRASCLGKAGRIRFRASSLCRCRQPCQECDI